MAPTSWWTWVERLMLAREWTPADLSRASGVDQSVIGRWRSHGATPSPDNVRRVAEALRRPVKEAVVASGHYTAAELAGTVALDLSVVSPEDLSAEVYARMTRGVGRRRRRLVPSGPQHAEVTTVSHDVTDVSGESSGESSDGGLLSEANGGQT